MYLARPTRTRAAVGSCAIALGLLLTACGIGGGAGAGHGGGEVGTVAPDIGTVDVAEDPRAWKGVVTPALAESEVDPVIDEASPQLPVTVEVIGPGGKQDVTVTDASRILALDLYGTLSRTVFELGLGDRVVGRDTSTSFPEAADLPLVTPKGHDLSAEAILGLDPTVILADTSMGVDVLMQMEDAGIPVVWMPSDRNLDNVGEITQLAGDALGVPDAGLALAERIEGEVADVRSKIADVAPADDNDRLRTVFLYVRGSAGVYYMFGEGSGADALISAAGAYDVAGEIGWKGNRPVTAEGLIAAAPELVVMMDNGLDSVGGIDGLLEKMPALAQTAAGRNERIVTMSDSLVLGYGPLTADVINALAVAVHAPQELD